MGPVEVPKNAPPMFNVIATDDFLFRGQFGIIESWFKAGRPVKFHLYLNGGHGFGLGNPNRASNRWFDAFVHGSMSMTFSRPSRISDLTSTLEKLKKSTDYRCVAQTNRMDKGCRVETDQ
jgi:hypothetical protein